MTTWLRSALEKYTTVAIVTLNTIIFLLLINSGLYIIFKIRDAHFKPNPVINKYGLDRLRPAYPDKSDADITVELNELWSRPMQFDTFTGSRERPFNGTYVTVDPAGFRHIAGQAPWPPNPKHYNVFVFGGSTMFGYGIANHETVSSYLQADLRAAGATTTAVYNFGQGAWFSAQERILFEKMVLSGHKPNLAIFVDGLNEYHADGEANKTSIAEAEEKGNLAGLILPKIPLGRAFISFQQRLNKRFSTNRTVTSTDQAAKNFGDPEIVTSILNRYLTNKKITEAAAGNLGIKTLFVWQPVPLYKYNLSYHLFGKEADTDNDTHQFSRYTYPALAALIKNNQISLGNNFLWLADLQADKKEPLYVDSVHYNPAMSSYLSRAITEHLKNNSYLPIAVKTKPSKR